MDSFGSMKDLYSATLKTTYPIEIGNCSYAKGEVIARFEELSVAAVFQEDTRRVNAHGGFGDRPHVFWETTKDIKFNFSQGVFSKTQFALLNNSKMVVVDEGQNILLSNSETLESDENNKVTLKETPVGTVFVYNLLTGDKIEFTLSGKEITIGTPYTMVVVDYNFYYNSGATVLKIGDKLIKGFLEFEGRTRVKDDTTGQVVTGIIKIPKLKLTSDLSMRLGKEANPVVANFSAIGIPTGSRGNEYVSEFFYLEDDIDSDI